MMETALTVLLWITSTFLVVIVVALGLVVAMVVSLWKYLLK